MSVVAKRLDELRCHLERTKVGLGPSDIVLDADPAPLPKKGAEPPKFSAHIYRGQTAGYIKMPLGMEVGLSPGDLC